MHCLSCVVYLICFIKHYRCSNINFLPHQNVSISSCCGHKDLRCFVLQSPFWNVFLLVYVALAFSEKSKMYSIADVLKKVMCSLCQATFDRFTDLLAHHKNTHNSDLSHPLRCRACGRTQTSEAGLVHHQIYVCKMVERPFTCEVSNNTVQLSSRALWTWPWN